MNYESADVNSVLKTVFISYRRTSQRTAHLVYKSLKEHGYDTFMDVENLDSQGLYPDVLLRQIEARGHFVLILTPDALNRCVSPDDWVRKEIERALESRRNIVPLFFDDFDYKNVPAEVFTGKLAVLPSINGLPVPPNTLFFDDAMRHMRERFLGKLNTATVLSVPAEDLKTVTEKIRVADLMDKPSTKEINAEWFLRRGAMHYYQRSDYEQALQDFSKALEMNPRFEQAYWNRAMAHHEHGNLRAAIADYTEFLRLVPRYQKAYLRRAEARHQIYDYAGAIEDYSVVIRQKPKEPETYVQRGSVRFDQGDYAGAVLDYTAAVERNPHEAGYLVLRAKAYRCLNNLRAAADDLTTATRMQLRFAEAHYERGIVQCQMNKHLNAIADFSEAIRIVPAYAAAYFERGIAYEKRRELDKAINDFSKAIELDPEMAQAYYNRAMLRERKRDKTLLRSIIEDYQTYLDFGGDHIVNQAQVEQKLRDLKRRL